MDPVEEWVERSRKWHINQVRRVAEDSSAEIIDGTICDIQSASAVIAVFDVLKPPLQEKAQRMSFASFGAFAWKHVS